MPITHPTITSISPTSGNIGSGFTLTCNGANYDGTEQVNFGSFSPATSFVSATQITATITSGMVAVAGNVSVSITNDLGTSGTATFAVNNPAPTLGSISPTNAAAGGTAFTMTCTGTNFVTGSTVSFGGSAPAVTTTFVSTTSLSVSVSSSMLATPTTFTVTVTNPSPGGGTSGGKPFSVTQPVPTLSAITPSSVIVGSGNTNITFTGTNFISGVSTCYLAAVPLTTTFVSNTQLVGVVPSSDLTSPTSYALSVVNGAVSSSTKTLSVVNPIASITSISPSTCTAGAAQFTLTINGTNFISGCVAKWSGSSLTTTFVSSTQVTAVVPAANVASAGTFQVTVTNSGVAASNQSSFVVGATNPSPTLTSISPNSEVANTGAVNVTCTGTNFISSSVVRWNGSSRTTTFVNSTTLIAAITSSDTLTAGTATVTVFTPTPGGGVSSGQSFTISSSNPAPGISSISPTSIAAGSSQFTLTVSGWNFISTSRVLWNGAALSTTYVGGTTLTAVVPAATVSAAGTASVSVNNPAPGGGATSTLPFSITSANPSPTITSLSPASILQSSSGFTLTVNGTNFVTTSVVNWVGSARTTTFVSSTQLTAAILTADLTSSGTKAISVTNPSPGGGTSSGVNFTVTTAGNNPIPTITSVSPTSVTAGSSGFTLTVNGTGFVTGGVSTVKFNGTSRTTTFVSSVQVTAAILAADVSAAGSYPVTVVNGTPGGGTSNALTFPVTFINPVPVIVNLNPSQVVRGGGTITETIAGSGFVSPSVINYGGSAKTTTFIDSNTLSCSLVAADYPAAPGSISKFNPLAHTEVQSTNATVVRTLSRGTALTPAITTIADTSTGVFFPYDGAVSLAVGSTESLRSTLANNTFFTPLTVTAPGYGGQLFLNSTDPTFHESDLCWQHNGTNMWILASDWYDQGAQNFSLIDALNGHVLLTIDSNDRCYLGGAGGLGSPVTQLDLDGDIALRSGSLTLVNGLNSNITLPTFSKIRISGPTAAFSVGGFVATSNKRVYLYNSLTQPMTIVQEDASSTAANRIKTMTGANVTLPVGPNFATFSYDATDSRWILESTSTPTHLSAGGSTPSVAFTSGGGTSPSAAVESGSTDSAGTITLTVGSGSPGSTGTVTLTFGTPYVTNMPVIILQLVKGATGWGNGADVQVTTQSLTAPVFTWTNLVGGTATALTVSTTYKISYMVIAK